MSEVSSSNQSNDLATELREHAAFYKGVERPAEYICNKAAEGVEKLAAELYGAETMIKHAVLNEAELRAEIERLTRELDDRRHLTSGIIEEKDLLRAALERIVGYECDNCDKADLAREALTGTSLGRGADETSTGPTPDETIYEWHTRQGPFMYSTSYCEKHKNMPWSMTVLATTVPRRVVCPICEPPDKTSPVTTKGD